MTPLPPRLAACRETLVALDPDAQTIGYNPAAWRRKLGADDPDLEALAARFPKAIRRSDLRTLSAEAHVDTSLARRLFLASMVWGYGTVGYGPHRTLKNLNDPGCVDAVTGALTAIGAGDLRRAYGSYRVFGCGQAFWTKYLYAAGLGCDANPMPLVLDSLVATALRTLGGDGALEPSDYLTPTLGRFTDGWVRFVTDADAWAKALGCRADAIEMLLFSPPNAFTQWEETRCG